MFNRSILFYHLPWEVVNVTVQSGGKQAHAHILTVDLGQSDRYHYLVLLEPATGERCYERRGQNTYYSVWWAQENPGANMQCRGTGIGVGT
jgi:hypothetical protein